MSVYRGETLIGEITRLSLFDEDPRSGRLWQAIGSQVTTIQLGQSQMYQRPNAGWLAGAKKTAPTVGVEHAGAVSYSPPMAYS